MYQKKEEPASIMHAKYKLKSKLILQIYIIIYTSQFKITKR